jgi:hypothetical protein
MKPLSINPIHLGMKTNTNSTSSNTNITIVKDKIVPNDENPYPTTFPESIPFPAADVNLDKYYFIILEVFRKILLTDDEYLLANLRDNNSINLQREDLEYIISQKNRISM